MIIRKNAFLLSDDEWEHYCKAIMTLKYTYPGGRDYSIYDQFVALHLGVWGLQFGTGVRRDGAHDGPAFLPWHREYLRRYELALASVDATVTLPYWNFGLGQPEETEALFTEDRMGSRSGELTKGYFSRNYWHHRGSKSVRLNWEVHPNLRPVVSLDGDAVRSEALVRSTRPQPVSGLPQGDLVREILEIENYSRFARRLEDELHNPVHNWVGGDMARMTSPNDPIFFMLHAQIDRLWAMWQRKHYHRDQYVDDRNRVGPGDGHGLYDPMWPWDAMASHPGSLDIQGENPTRAVRIMPRPAFIDVVTPNDVLDTSSLGYTYDDVTWSGVEKHEYFLSKRARRAYDGMYREVHIDTCRRLPYAENRVSLGNHSSCHAALREAKLNHHHYVDGCALCIPQCHRW